MDNKRKTIDVTDGTQRRQCLSFFYQIVSFQGVLINFIVCFVSPLMSPVPLIYGYYEYDILSQSVKTLDSREGFKSSPEEIKVNKIKPRS